MYVYVYTPICGKSVWKISICACLFSQWKDAWHRQTGKTGNHFEDSPQTQLLWGFPEARHREFGLKHWCCSHGKQWSSSFWSVALQSFWSNPRAVPAREAAEPPHLCRPEVRTASLGLHWERKEGLSAEWKGGERQIRGGFIITGHSHLLKLHFLVVTSLFEINNWGMNSHKRTNHSNIDCSMCSTALCL